MAESERQARETYLAFLPSLYAAERTAGIFAPPAPLDPTTPKGTYAKGTRVKVDARILEVNPLGTSTRVVFARGVGADPAAWKDEAIGMVEGSFPLRPGSVATLDAVLTPSQNPPWRIVGATPRK